MCFVQGNACMPAILLRKQKTITYGFIARHFFNHVCFYWPGNAERHDQPAQRAEHIYRLHGEMLPAHHYAGCEGSLSMIRQKEN